VYNYSQVQTFVIFFIIGVLISILFDFFRALRKVFKTSDLITTIEDIVFLVISSVIVVSSVFKITGGDIRLYIFISMFLRHFYVFFDN